MACSKCKKKQEREAILKELNRVEKKVKVGAVVILLLTLYGIYSLVSSLL